MKYYLNKVTFNLTKCYDIIITTKNKNEIIPVFEKINNVSPEINGNRKRMIDIDFIAILNVQINVDYIKIIWSKKTLQSSQLLKQYWN